MIRDILSLPRSVHILCIGTFINRAGTFLIPFLTLYLENELKLGERFATRTMGLYGLGAIVAALAGGHCADWIGRRVVMLLSLFGGGAALVAFSFVKAPWAIMTTIVFFALVAEMYRPAASAMIGDLVGPALRPSAFGLMYVAINMGFAVGPVVGGLMLQYYTFQTLFWCDAVTSAVYGVIILARIRETLPPRPQPAALPAADAGADAPGPARPLAVNAAVHMLHDTTFMVCCAASLLVAFVFMQSMSTFPLYLAGLGIGPEMYGRIIALNGVIIVVFQIPLTSFLSRFHRGVVVAAASLVIGLGFSLNALAATPLQFAGTVVVWTLGEMMSAAFLMSIVSDLAPPELRGRYMGVLGSCYSLAMMLGVPLGGEILVRYGGTAVWLSTGAASVLASALYYSIRHRTGRREHARA